MGKTNGNAEPKQLPKVVGFRYITSHDGRKFTKFLMSDGQMILSNGHLSGNSYMVFEEINSETGEAYLAIYQKV